MPTIRRQEIRSDGFLIETAEFGTLECSLSVSGTQYTLTVRKNGVQTHQTTLTNPTVADMEAWARTAIDATVAVNTKGGLVAGVHFAWHVFNRNPLTIQIRTSNTTIPANWWQE